MTTSMIGASGLIGRHLLAYLGSRTNIEGTYFQNAFSGGVGLDITDPGAVEAYIASRRPNVLIWLSGTKDVPRCERDLDYAFRLNTVPIESLVRAMHATGATGRIIFFSTDYVFDGVRGRYSDDEEANPHTNYGRSNLAAEQVLKQSGLPYTIIRTSAVMARGGGFLGWLIARLIAGQTTSLYQNVFFTPTPFLTLARGLDEILSNDAEYNDRVLHIAGTRTNRYEFAQRVATLLQINTSVLVPEILDLSQSSMQADLSLVPSAALAKLCDRWQIDLAEYLINDPVY